jgi:hypothetical protein
MQCCVRYRAHNIPPPSLYAEFDISSYILDSPAKVYELFYLSYACRLLCPTYCPYVVAPVTFMYGTNNTSPSVVVCSRLRFPNTHSAWLSQRSVRVRTDQFYASIRYPSEPQITWNLAFSFALIFWVTILWPKIEHWVGEYVNRQFIHKPTPDVSKFPVRIGVPRVW